MAEEATIALDVKDFAGEPSEPVVEQTTTEESSTEETKVEDVTTSEEPPVGEEAAAEEEDETGNTEETPGEAEPEQPKKTAEARKEQLSTEIRDLVSQRNKLRDDIARKNAEVYQPASLEQLQEQGMDEATARVTALEQRTQIAEFNARAADVTASLNTEALQVMHDFPVFDPESPQYDKGLSKLAEGIYTKAAGIQTDPKTGLIYDAAVMPYQIYRSIAQAHEAGASTGKVQGQRASEKMLAATETPTSVAPPTPKEDPFLSGLTRGMKR